MSNNLEELMEIDPTETFLKGMGAGGGLQDSNTSIGGVDFTFSNNLSNSTIIGL